MRENSKMFHSIYILDIFSIFRYIYEISIILSINSGNNAKPFQIALKDKGVPPEKT
jgi:hypothetical protein